MTPSRRSVIGTGLASLAAGVFSPAILHAQTPAHSLKWGTSFDKAHPSVIRLGEALDRVRKETDGQVDIKLFPNGQLGTDAEMLSQMRSGGLHFWTSAGVQIATLVPGADIADTPFAFKSYDELWKAMDGELGAHLVRLCARSKVHAFGRMWDHGFRNVSTSSRAVNGPDDLKGMKIRTPPSKMLISLFKALGAAPVAMSGGEIFTGLQTGLIEGQENPLHYTISMKFDEVQKFVAMTRHSWTGLLLVGNADVWRGLPEKYREVIDRNLSQSAVAQREDIVKIEAASRETLEKRGIKFTDPDPELFRAALKKVKFYEDIRKSYGADAWSLLERFTGSLA